MNKYKEIVIIAAIVTLPLLGRFAGTLAQSPTSLTPLPSKAASPTTAVEKNILNLKEKIATKVSQLTKGESNLTVGTVSAITKEGVSLSSASGQTVLLTIDDTVTNMYSVATGKKVAIKKDAIEKGDYLIATGPKIESTITANMIYRDTPLVALSAQVVNIDKEALTIDVVTTTRQEKTLDIETKTKQTIVDTKTGEIVRAGFSKIKIGDSVHFIYKKADDTEKKPLPLIRLLIIPQEYFSVPTE